MPKNTSSPVPRKVSPAVPTQIEGMTFPKALEYLIDGKKITRIAWGRNDIFGLLRNAELQIYRGDTDKEFHVWAVNEGDLVSFDWIVLEN